MTALDDLVRPDRYPRSSRYDPAWLIGLDMGPHPLWLLENLLPDLDLRPGMRVLDLGSGRGATSVFLAREFDVRVTAADLWVSPEDAAAVFAEAGVADRVRAVRAEAHALPFPSEHFDAIVSIDSYEYFGTADGYFPYLLRFLKPGGQVAVATPGMTREVRDLGEVPRHIRDCVDWEAIAWHTPHWWRFQWEITELATVTSALLQPDGWQDWLLWSRAVREVEAAKAAAGRQCAEGPHGTDSVIAMLEADQGRYLSFTLLAARKHAPAS